MNDPSRQRPEDDDLDARALRVAREMWAGQSSTHPGSPYAALSIDLMRQRIRAAMTWAVEREGRPAADEVAA